MTRMWLWRQHTPAHICREDMNVGVSALEYAPNATTCIWKCKIRYLPIIASSLDAVLRRCNSKAQKQVSSRTTEPSQSRLTPGRQLT